MPDHDAAIDELRLALRRLYAAAPGGTWAAPGEQALSGGLVAIDADGRRRHLGALFYGESVAQLAAASRNALPRLFREIDRLRARTRGVTIEGTVR